MERRAIEQILVPHTQRLEDRVRTRYGPDALKSVMSIDFPSVHSFNLYPWASPGRDRREPTVSEVVAQAEGQVASRVRDYRVAVLVKQAVGRLQKARREGAPISDEEIDETKRRVQGLSSDGALTLEEATGWLDNLVEPFLARSSAGSGQVHRVRELAARVAEEARFHPVDLWIHTRGDRNGALLYDLYWTPVGEGRDQAFRILTPAELGLLHETQWHFRREHHDYFHFKVVHTFQPGVRYRIPIPAGVREEAIERFLNRHDWRATPAASPTGNVIEVEWPLALTHDKAGLEVGLPAPLKAEQPKVEAGAELAGSV